MMRLRCWGCLRTAPGSLAPCGLAPWTPGRDPGTLQWSRAELPRWLLSSGTSWGSVTMGTSTALAAPSPSGTTSAQREGRAGVASPVCGILGDHGHLCCSSNHRRQNWTQFSFLLSPGSFSGNSAKSHGSTAGLEGNRLVMGPGACVLLLCPSLLPPPHGLSPTH